MDSGKARTPSADLAPGEARRSGQSLQAGSPPLRSPLRASGAVGLRADFATAQHLWRPETDTDPDALKNTCRKWLWGRRFGERHQTIPYSAPTPEQFLNVIPVSQNENNPLRFGTFQERTVETGFGLKEESGELCVGPLGRYVGAGGGGLALSGGGAPRSDRRKLEVEGGEEVPPPPRAPLREVMWGQTENTRQGPEKAGSGWTPRAETERRGDRGRSSQQYLFRRGHVITSCLIVEVLETPVSKVLGKSTRIYTLSRVIKIH
ncbi:uncharacterized protein LOC133256263 [Bos javanicus]|uniref:uncharacterized protein LOC133256263 n=1 Tax=Bos javanicus TaxID=9906 RepID=UPI002AA8716E|nr:uncharacterized protein LOC133256263 [Bos javanicus]